VSILIALLSVIAGVVSVSPLFYAHLSVPGNYIFLAFAGILAVLLYREAEIDFRFFLLTLIIVSLAAIAGLYWGELGYIFIPTYFILSLYICVAMRRESLESFVRLASVLVGVLVIGGIIGFAAALSGVESQHEFPNPDGRPNYLYF